MPKDGISRALHGAYTRAIANGELERWDFEKFWDIQVTMMMHCGDSRCLRAALIVIENRWKPTRRDTLRKSRADIFLPNRIIQYIGSRHQKNINAQRTANAIHQFSSRRRP
ncbi:hypothetical protein HN011_006426 [Eciton burchellii]|nr:hypothetical protein HN011_006426 [Eciton burchellii]